MSSSARLSRHGWCVVLLGMILTLGWQACPVSAEDLYQFTASEKKTLNSLWIDSLGEIPDDPSNAYDTDPQAARFGRMVFHDKRFSANGEIACASCHPRSNLFVDDSPLAEGLGTTDRRTMPLLGVGYNIWFFWDGRKDSLWSQTLAPFEDPVEHGITRTRAIQLVYESYTEEYESTFGPLPPLQSVEGPAFAGPLTEFELGRQAWERIPEEKRDTINSIYANVGKAVAAYVRLHVPMESRFDRFTAKVLSGDGAEAKGLMEPEEVAGLKLFIGKASCTNCHFGPLFTNSDFHNLLVPPGDHLRSDHGRAVGIRQVKEDIFNCLGKYSDASSRSDCGELVFMDDDVAKYSDAFKTPSLRNVTERRFYMHHGQLETLDDVFDHYRAVGNRVPELGHFEFSDREVEQLKAFLATLSSPVRILEPFNEVVEKGQEPE